jgi:acyl-CoA oxidase
MLAARGHRSDLVNQAVLPLCQPLVEAIGHRMAYDAAISKGIEPTVMDVYVASILKLDSAWYAEHGLSQRTQRDMEAVAISAMLPHLPRYVKEMDVTPYITAPLVSDASWSSFVSGLPRFQGHAVVGIFPEDTASIKGSRAGLGSGRSALAGAVMSAKL